MGPPKRGKSITAVNVSVGALLDGYSVAHYIMEGGEEARIEQMYDAKISGVSKDNLKKDEEIVRRKINQFFSSGATGRLLIKFYPSQTITAKTIEAHLKKAYLLDKFKPKLILIDYLGLMRPADYRMVKDGDRYSIFGQIAKELLGLAQKGPYAVWLLHHSTRGSLKKGLIGMDDSADSMEPMRDADFILSLNQSEEEKEHEPELIRIYAAGGREAADNWVETFEIDKSKCQIRNLSVEVRQELEEKRKRERRAKRRKAEEERDD